MIEVGDLIPTVEAGQARSVQALTHDINRALEAGVLRDPANWFWVHNRWKAQNAKQSRIASAEEILPADPAMEIRELLKFSSRFKKRKKSNFINFGKVLEFTLKLKRPFHFEGIALMDVRFRSISTASPCVHYFTPFLLDSSQRDKWARSLCGSTS